MGVGKLAAQVAHASVSSLEEARKRRSEWVEAWLETGQKKVVLKVTTIDQLVQLAHQCAINRLPHAMIEDAGLTQLPPGTKTALGIGPAPEDEVDKITGNLPLL